MIYKNISEVITDELSEGAVLNKKMPGFQEDYLVVHCLIRKYRPKKFLEIGTNVGSGTNVICNAGEPWGMGVFSLDLPPEMAGKSKQYPGGEEVGSKCERPYTQLLGDSLLFDYSGYDAVYIDGEHDYGHVLHESRECIKNKVRLVIYHDADIKEVGRAIEESYEGDGRYSLYGVEGTRMVYALRVEVPNKIAVVIITYNASGLITKQVECIRRFCKDDFDIVIFDNSTIPKEIDTIKYFTTGINVCYTKIYSSDENGSESAIFALNFSYFKLRDKYDFFCYFDHDMFPIRDFSILEIIHGRAIAGLGQGTDRLYFAPQCVMWDNRTIDHNLINFSANQQLGLDTGGELYKIVEKYGKDACVVFNEKYYQNQYFRTGFYNFYSTINDDMFMHFINASGWNPSEKNEERVLTLLSILEERING